MDLLLTNDDGIEAPGIAALVDALQTYLAHQNQTNGSTPKDFRLIVVAPDRGRSECSHSVTTSRDLEIKRLRPNWYSIDGTPVDCVRVALTCICPNALAVFSGINAGANVGVDLLVSGTFAAAREAAILGRPALAISQYRRPDVPKTWDHAGSWLGTTFDRFFESVESTAHSRSDLLWNVNLPAIHPIGDTPPSLIECPVDRTPMERTGPLLARGLQLDRDTTTLQLESDFHGRHRTPGSDIDQCFGGKITLSRVYPFVSEG